MSTPKLEPADEALSKLRVARGTLIGVRHCLVDALTFVNRGIDKLEDCHARMTAAFTAADLPMRLRPGRPPPKDRARKKKAPTCKAGARRRAG